MQAGYDNSMQCALFHMVHWVTAYKKASKGNLLSWENSWIQDLCQYYCYGVVVMPNKSKRPMPAWILDHFWNLSNNYCSNLIPTRFFSAFKGGCGETDVTLTIKAIAKSPPAEGDEIEGEDVIALYDGLVDTCYAGVNHNKGIPYNPGMVKSARLWREDVAVRGRASAMAALLLSYEQPDGKLETKSLWPKATLKRYAKLHLLWRKADLRILELYKKAGKKLPWERPKVSSARKKARKLDMTELRTTEASASSLFALSAFTDSDSES